MRLHDPSALQETLTYKKNPEREIDMFSQALQRINNGQRVLFLEQLVIYKNLADYLKGEVVHDAGCGLGIGTNILDKKCFASGSDVSEKNIKIAGGFFPEVHFFRWDLKEKNKAAYENLLAIEVIEHIEDVPLIIENLLLACSKRLFLSTPNRNNLRLGQDKPINDFHVMEYTPSEVLELIGDHEVILRDPFTFEKVGTSSEATPMIYEVLK